MPTDQRLKDALTSIFDNMVDGLTTAGLDLPARRYIHTGLIAQDFVGENCADAFVVSWQGTTPGAIEAASAGGVSSPAIRCAMPLTHQFVIVLFRCVPTAKPGSQGKLPPTNEQLTDSAEQIAIDALTIPVVLIDHVLANDLLGNGMDIVGIGQILPVGPNGGLGGTQMSLFATVL